MIDQRIDPVTIQRADKLHPSIKLIVFDNLLRCIDMKVPIRIVQGLRTIDEQNALYAQGRTTEGKIVTKAKGGESWHNYGLAFDFCLLRNGKEISWNRKEDLDGDGQSDWQEVVNLFLLTGFDWGGNWTGFPDYPHLQKVFGLTIKKAKELLEIKKVDSNGYIIF